MLVALVESDSMGVSRTFRQREEAAEPLPDTSAAPLRGVPKRSSCCRRQKRRRL